MEQMHSLLRRQLKRHFGDQFSIPAQWRPFVERVNDAYLEFDADREMMEHSLELSSQELLDANSEMRAVFQAIPDLVLRLDHEGTILDIKAGTSSDMMLKREDLIGKRVQDVPLKDVGRQFSDALKAVIENDSPTSVEYSAVLHGHESHYEARLAPLPDKQIAVIIRNITERKQSLRLMGSAVEQSGDSIVITDADLDLGPRFLFVNPAFTRMTGYTAAEVIGQTPRILQGPKSDRVTLSRLRETLERGETFSGQTTNYRKDRTEFNQEWKVTPIRDSSGAVTHFLGIQRDITERMRTENALHESKRFAESIAENSTSAIYLIDLETGRNIYGARNIAARLGYSNAQIDALGDNPLARLIHPEDRPRVVQHFAQFADLRDSRVVDLEFRLKDASGDWRWIWARDTVFTRWPGGSACQVLGTAQDITERKRAEAELAATHQALVEASRQAGMAEIATNVLHNVGNILNSVNVSAALVASTLRNSRARGLSQAVRLMDEHAAELAEFLTRDEKGKLLPGYLIQSTQALAQEQQRMIEELAHLTQSIDHIKGVVATQQTYARGVSLVEPTQICELAEDALRMNGEALERHRISVVKQFATVPVLRLDRARVLQILVNLISNASNAMESMTSQSNQITLTVDTTAESNLRVSVKDNGAGIPADNLTRIFVHGFTTRKKGHGFGLHSCALAARQMRGTLTAHSDGPGQGAVFSLELPIDGDQATP